MKLKLKNGGTIKLQPGGSIWNQISNPRQTYTDGYGTERPVNESKAITIGRKVYNTADRFFNGPSKEWYNERGMSKPNASLGVAGFVSPAPRGMAALKAYATSPYKVRIFENVGTVKESDILKYGDRVIKNSRKSINNRLKTATEQNMVRRLKDKLQKLDKTDAWLQRYKSWWPKYKSYKKELESAESISDLDRINLKYWNTTDYESIPQFDTKAIAKRLGDLENHLFGHPANYIK